MDTFLVPLSLAFTTLFSLIYYYLVRPLNYFSKQGVKTAPGALPGFGHVLPVFTFRENASTLCNKLYELYCSKPDDRMIGAFFLRTPMLIVRDPELVRCALVKDFNCFRNNATLLSKELDPFMAYNPFFAEDDMWRDYRKHLVSCMSPKKLKALFRITRQASLKFEAHLEKITSGANESIELEFKELCQNFTAELVANTSFGVEGNAFFATVGKLFESNVVTALRHLLSMFLPKLASLLGVGFMPRKANDFFRDTLYEIARQRRENGIEIEDFLQMSIENMKNVDEIDKDVVTGRVGAYFFDAYDTSASVAAFVCYQLSRHPEIQNKARQEIRDVLDRHEDAKGGEVSYEALEEMTYLEHCIMETLRLHPILGIVLRTCTQAITLEDSTGQKCRLEPGHLLCVPTQSLHMDPEFWRDPEVFDPDRHSEERKDEMPKFAYLPFSMGPRICAGMRYGLMSVKIMLVRLLSEYELELSNKMTMPLRYDTKIFLTTADRGLWLRLKRRKDS